MSNFRYAPYKHARNMCYNCGNLGGHVNGECTRINLRDPIPEHLSMICNAELNFFNMLHDYMEEQRVEVLYTKKRC